MLYKTLKDNKIFLIPYLTILLSILPFIVIYSKSAVHLFINQFHSAFSDWLFRHLTFLGDGLFIIVPALILLFFSLRHFIFLITAYFSTGLVAQILKRVFFEDMARPIRHFQDDLSLHLIDGIQMHSGRSFPSGHATSAFALFICLALLSKNSYLKLICFLAACLVAFSRVYLSQHFLIDIYAGSIIGSAGALAFYLLFYRDDRRWHSWSFQKLLKQQPYA